MNDKLETELQQQLRAGEEELDAATLAKLHEARQRALEAIKAKPASPWLQGWVPVAAAASVVMLAVLVIFSLRAPGDIEPEIKLVDNNEPAGESQPEEQPFADFEATMILAAEAEELLQPSADEPAVDGADTDELLDLYENLEFYEWLALEDPEGAAS